jgi:hypothetical protein
MDSSGKLAFELVGLILSKTSNVPDAVSDGMARVAQAVLAPWFRKCASDAAVVAIAFAQGASREDRLRFADLLNERAQDDGDFKELLAVLVKKLPEIADVIARAAERAAAALDISRMVEVLGDRKDEYLTAVHLQVESALKEMSAAEAWSIILTGTDGTKQALQPQLKTDYLRALIAMTRDRDYQGCKAQSSVTGVVLNAVERATIEFYRDPATQAMLGEELARQFSMYANADSAVSSEAQAMISLLVGEMRNASVATPIKAVVIDRVAAVLIAFLTSATGHEILVVLGKVMATHIGHAVVAYVAVATAKVVSLSAVKAAVIVAVKKIGIATILKTTIGKVIIGVMLAAAKINPSRRNIDIATFAVLAVALPMVAVHEYRKLPGKLAKELPVKVIDILSGSYDELNRSAAEHLLGPVLDSVMWQVIGEHLDWAGPLA